MGSYNQMARLNVESKDSAFVTKFKINIEMAEMLGSYNTQPKKRQQIIQAVIRDIQVAKDKKLATVDNYGYIVFENTAYNPETGVLIFSYNNRNAYYYNEDDIKDYRFVFTKPVVKLTEDEIYKMNTNPSVPVISKGTKRQFYNWYGPKTEKFTIKRYYDAVASLSYHHLDKKGEYDGELTEEQFNLINNTPKIMYLLIPVMIGVKPHTVIDKFMGIFGHSQYDDVYAKKFVRVLKYAQIQEESSTPIMPKNERNEQENITKSLNSLRDGYMSMLQMFDTSMRHRTEFRPTYSYNLSYDNTKEVEDYGYLSYKDDRYNFGDGRSCNIISLNKVKVPTNESLLKLKEILDEMDFKNNVSWTTREGVLAILEALMEANVEYDEIEFEPVNNMPKYPYNEFDVEWLYMNPDVDTSDMNYKFKREYSESSYLVGMGYKKDLMTIYNLLVEIASRNSYLRDLIYETELIVKGFRPEFKLDCEVYKNTYEKAVTDDEILKAMKIITDLSSEFYGEVWANIGPVLTDSNQLTLCNMIKKYDYKADKEGWMFPRITFDISNEERFEEFRRYIKAWSLHTIYDRENLRDVYMPNVDEKDRLRLITYVLIRAVYGTENFCPSPKTSTDGFVTIERMSHSDVIDTDFNEIGE